MIENAYENAKRWDTITNILTNVFGEENIENNDNKLIIKHSISDPHRELKNEIAIILHGLNNHEDCFITTGIEETQSQSESPIHISSSEASTYINIHKESDPKIVYEALGKFENLTQSNRLTDNALFLDPKIPDVELAQLESISRLNWRKVLNTAYGEEVIQPSISGNIAQRISKDPQLRDDYEMALAPAVIKNRAEALMSDWIQQQHAIEDEKGLPPAIAVPSNMVSVDATRSAYADKEVRKRLNSVLER